MSWTDEPTKDLKSLHPEFSPFIVENTNRWRLDKTTEGYELTAHASPARDSETMVFTGPDAGKLERDLANSWRSNPDWPLDQRFTMIWNRFQERFQRAKDKIHRGAERSSRIGAGRQTTYNEKTQCYVTLERPAKPGTAALYLVSLTGAPASEPHGYIEKFRNTRTDTHPYKATVYPLGFRHKDRNGLPVAQFLGAFYPEEGGMDAAQVAIRNYWRLPGPE